MTQPLSPMANGATQRYLKRVLKGLALSPDSCHVRKDIGYGVGLMTDYGWAVHEASHAIAYLAAAPDLVERVEVMNCGDYAQVVPVFNCEPEALGIINMVNFTAGCLGERLWSGERNCVYNLVQTRGNTKWLEALFDTPHGGGFDKFAFDAIADHLDPFPRKEFARALVTTERDLERYLPLVDIDALHRGLFDGGFTLTARDLKPVMH